MPSARVLTTWWRWLQVIASPADENMWVSGALPGAVHDLTAARIWGIMRELAAAGLITLSDKGYNGTGQPVLTPYRGRNKPASQKDVNRAPARLRAPGERRTPSSSAGRSCASCAAIPGAQDSSPKPYTSFRPAKSEDEKAQ